MSLKRISVTACLVGFGFASQIHAAEWLVKEFLDTWNAPQQGVEEFLNVECQPSGLDGIQLIGVQRGHGEVLHLHVFCRHDKDGSVRYQVTRPTESRGKIDSNVLAHLGSANVKIGPFWFGDDENLDGFFLIEKLH